MNKHHLKGAGNKAKGEVKEAVGKATGNDRVRAGGAVDKAKGEWQQTVGDAKDAVDRAVDKAADRAAR